MLRNKFENIWSKTAGYFPEAEVKDSGFLERRQLVDMGEYNRSKVAFCMKLLIISGVRRPTVTPTSIS
jgi:hypothetical protein